MLAECAIARDETERDGYEFHIFYQKRITLQASNSLSSCIFVVGSSLVADKSAA
jgi:hypothetical protein